MSKPILPQIASGDQQAVDQFLDRYAGLVWTLASRMSKLRSDIEDATQEIFLEIWKNADRFDPSRSSETTFVTMIARRKLIDRLRKSTRRPDEVTMDDQSTPLENRSVNQAVQAEIAEEAAIARQCLQQLRSDERKIIELSIFQQLSQSKISEVLKIPIGTVKTHARRGMLRLRELVSNYSIAGGVS